MLDTLPPELAANIAIHLNQHDLTQLVLVNNDLNTLYTPLIWKTLTVFCERQRSSLLPTTSPATETATTPNVTVKHATLARNSQFIHSLCVRAVDFAIIEALAMHALNLQQQQQQLTSVFISAGYIENLLLDPLISILQKSPQLEDLHVRGCLQGSVEVQRLFSAIVQSLPSLKSLNLFDGYGSAGSMPRSVDLRDFLETCPSKLEVLVLNLGHHCGEKDEDILQDLNRSRSNVGGRAKPHPKLKVFSLCLNYPASNGAVILPLLLVPFLEGCPNLELVVDVPPPLFGRECTILYTCGIIDTLKRTTKIRALRSFRAQSLAPESHGGIIEATSQLGLQRLTTNKSGSICSQDIQSILHQERTLWELRPDVIPTLLASDIEHSPWSCKWLRLLNVKIGGIPRPDIRTDARGLPIRPGTVLHSGTMKESRAIQRKVYAQLATLECLEELLLGVHSPFSEVIFVKQRGAEISVGDISGSIRSNGSNGEAEEELFYYDTGLQQTCLEMSLESGLGLLSGLRSLKMLGVHNMEHRMDIGELKWMKKHWPLMRHIGGIPASGRSFGRFDTGRHKPGREQWWNPSTHMQVRYFQWYDLH
ncbi:MAG: hypothetical protein J3R72DRAFT_444561 [Linnemannia gamsii]|nr:MAG: hypothetical protein J3R72DRAFT_444561 [Linnemannia gamsii]